MRILVVGFSYVVDVYQSKLEALAQLPDVQVGLLSPSKWYFPQWGKSFPLETAGKNFEVFPANVWFFNGRNGAYLYPIPTVYKTLNYFKPDIVYIEQEVFSLSTYQVTMIAKLMKIPVAIFCWENMEKRFYFRKPLMSYVLNYASFITPGNSEAGDLLRRWGYEGGVEVLPQIGVDTNIFFPIKNKSEGSKFSIGFVGRFVYEKGIDLILKVAKQLSDDGIEIEVLLCGTGPYKSELSNLAKELGITDLVKWLGKVSYTEVPQAIAKMDVLVLPSRTQPGVWKEQFGHVLIEAMAMKVPVVGSSSGAIPDVVGIEDLIFAEGDADALYEILKKLAIHPGWRFSMAERGYDRIDTHYSDRAIAERLHAIFSGIC